MPPYAQKYGHRGAPTTRHAPARHRHGEYQYPVPEAQNLPPYPGNECSTQSPNERSRPDAKNPPHLHTDANAPHAQSPPRPPGSSHPSESGSPHPEQSAPSDGEYSRENPPDTPESPDATEAYPPQHSRPSPKNCSGAPASPNKYRPPNNGQSSPTAAKIPS